jgi:hypothetical protein
MAPQRQNVSLRPHVFGEPVFQPLERRPADARCLAKLVSQTRAELPVGRPFRERTVGSVEIVKCSHFSYFGRVSSRALAPIDLEESTNANGGTSKVGIDLLGP